MWDELIHLWSSICDPEYLHLLLESLPLYGLGVGLVFLSFAMLAGERKTRVLAILVITLSCASVWPYQILREEASPRILATRDPTLGPLIEEQTERRKRYNWLYYTLAVAGAVTLVLQLAGKGKWFVGVMVMGTAVLLWFSIWMHKKECEVYHRNIIKYRPPR